MRSLTPDFSGVRAKGGSDQLVIAIGDVHGRVDLLKSLLAKVEHYCESVGKPETIVFLGDYIDRGDDSRGVLELLLEIKNVGGDRIKCLIGNHEDMMIAFLNGRSDGQLWLANGGLQTFASYGLTAIRPGVSTAKLAEVRDTLKERIGNEVLSFLANLETSWQWGDYYFSHAGVDPGSPLNAQDPEFLVWGHPKFREHLRKDAACVVHGHYVTPQVDATRSRIGIDTGAYFAGTLSALAISNRKLTVIASTL